MPTLNGIICAGFTITLQYVVLILSSTAEVLGKIFERQSVRFCDFPFNNSLRNSQLKLQVNISDFILASFIASVVRRGCPWQ